MVVAHWVGLEGKRLRYRDQTWELTGEVDVRERGELLAVEATEADDVRHETATLYFAVRNPSDSLNPGNLGEHFEAVEREDDRQFVVVKKPRRTYRYELVRLEYE